MLATSCIASWHTSLLPCFILVNICFKKVKTVTGKLESQTSICNETVPAGYFLVQHLCFLIPSVCPIKAKTVSLVQHYTIVTIMSSTSLLNNFYSQKLYEEHNNFTVINPIINLNYTESCCQSAKMVFYNCQCSY